MQGNQLLNYIKYCSCNVPLASPWEQIAFIKYIYIFFFLLNFISSDSSLPLSCATMRWLTEGKEGRTNTFHLCQLNIPRCCWVIFFLVSKMCYFWSEISYVYVEEWEITQGKRRWNWGTWKWDGHWEHGKRDHPGSCNYCEQRTISTNQFSQCLLRQIDWTKNALIQEGDPRTHPALFFSWKDPQDPPLQGISAALFPYPCALMPKNTSGMKAALRQWWEGTMEDRIAAGTLGAGEL